MAGISTGDPELDGLVKQWLDWDKVTTKLIKRESFTRVLPRLKIKSISPVVVQPAWTGLYCNTVVY
jgi:hypothetical protein